MRGTFKYFIVAFVFGLGLLAGTFLTSLRTDAPRSVSGSASKPVDGKKKVSEVTEWTCSMHPQVRQPKPGKCPICFMDLIPVSEGSSGDVDADAAELTLSPRAEKLAEIQVYPVERRLIDKTVRMVGKIAMDETRMAYITARMPGRIDRLFVNYMGIAVKKGDHMAEYFSPDLMVAQKELLLTAADLEDEQNSDSSTSSYGMTPAKTYESVIKKLKQWNLTDRNIQSILDKGEVSDHLTLYAPITGVVTHKKALEGEYFKTGDRLFTIADLSKVWVLLDAYESDLDWLRYGQEVDFTTESYPGEAFHGKISFIDPILNDATRTVTVRVVADNADGSMKPGMFVHAAVNVEITKNDEVVDPSLAGKWISPMHPEVVKNHPGQCDVCGMPLVKAESLGYAAGGIDDDDYPLVVPASAVLITGKRAVVYLKSKDRPGVYMGRTVTLGSRVGEFYIVEEGLDEGDLVVANGNFKIDSALQILAKPSMMSAPGDQDDGGESEDSPPVKFSAPDVFIQQLNMIYDSYFAIQRALSEDDPREATRGYENLRKMLSHISDRDLPVKTREFWRKSAEEIAAVVDVAMTESTLNEFRFSFSNLSAVVEQLAKRIGFSDKYAVVKFHCPMAFDNKGAFWLQDDGKLRNPYFGAAMLKCGEKVGTLSDE